MAEQANALKDYMNQDLSKPELIAVLSQATNMNEADLLAQMPGLNGAGLGRITTEDNGKIRVMDRNGGEEYLITLGDKVSIDARVDAPEGYDGH